MRPVLPPAGYQGDIQRALDLIFYRDPARSTISVADGDVQALFSGDEEAAERGLRVFFDRHCARAGMETGKVEVISEHPLTLKVFSLFEDREQRLQRDRYIHVRQRREGGHGNGTYR